MRNKTLQCLLLLATVFVVGCNRVALVSEGSPMRIGPDCNTKVYTLTETGWELSPNSVLIPEGWYIVPPSFVDKKE